MVNEPNFCFCGKTLLETDKTNTEQANPHTGKQYLLKYKKCPESKWYWRHDEYVLSGRSELMGCKPSWSKLHRDSGV